MKTSRVPVIVLLFILSFICTPAQKRAMVSDRLTEREEAPRVITPEPTRNPDSLISNSSYPMTVLGGWPLEDMSGGTTQLIGPSTDNENSVLAPIGFTFLGDGLRYAAFAVNGNGFAALGSSAPTEPSNVNAISTFADSLRIMPYWDDLCVGSNGKVHYKTIGAPGSRKLVVEWKNMQITRNGACSGPGGGTFQLWLLENTGVIQFIYGSGMTASSAADNGYSVGLQWGQATNFASVTTASATVSYTAANDSQTGAITPGTLYAFVPNMPPPPSGGNVNPLTQFSLQLNWTDNASTEIIYEIYCSPDNVTYNQCDILPPNSTSFAQSGLLPGTQYFYKVYATSEGAMSTPLFFSPTTLPAGNVSSTAAGGMWSSPGTWASGVVPQAGDNVTIVDGATVTIDTAAVGLNLTVGSTGSLVESEDVSAGAAATLTFEETAPHSLAISQNVLIKSNGIFATPGLGNVTGHVLSVGGNLTNNGGLDFSTNNNQAGADITFTGIPNTVFGGAGPVTDVRTITVNKGFTAASTLELMPTNFTVQGSATDTPGSGFLRLVVGTLKISGTFNGNHRTFPTAGYTVSNGTGIWLNNPNYTVAGQSGSVTFNNGYFRITSGTYNVGTSSGDSIRFRVLSGAVIEGGTVNVAGRFGVSAPMEVWRYEQSGGTINACINGDDSDELACFDTGTSSGSLVTITGGEIVIQNRNLASLGPHDYRHQAGTTGASTVTGGTVRFGNASTSGVTSFGGVGVLPNMVIDSTTGGHSFTFGDTGPLPNLTRDVLIGPGAGFVTGNGPYLMNGSSFVNNGILLSASVSSEFIWSDPAGNPTYSGTGVISAIMNRFTVLGQSVTLNSANNIRVRNINLITGNIINANKLTLGNNDTINNVIQIGSPASPTPAGTFDTSPVFQLGSGGETVRYLRTGSIRTTGPEINPARSLAGLTFDNDDPATDELNIVGGNLIVTGQLNLANGEIKTGANQLIHNGTVAGGGTGFVNGTVTRHIIVSGAYLIPVGVNGRSPMNVFVGLINSVPSVVSVKPVDATLPGLDPAVSASRYWEITQSGNITGRLTFFYTNADINGDEAAYGAWVSRGGGNPLRESQTNNPAENSVSSSPDLTNFNGNWGPGCCVVQRSVGGTVRAAGGAPIRNATVILSGGGLPAPRVAQTGSFGSYVFDNVLTGTQYNIFVSAKRFRFTPISRDIILAGDDFTQDFTANAQEGGLLFEREKD